MDNKNKFNKKQIDEISKEYDSVLENKNEIKTIKTNNLWIPLSKIIIIFIITLFIISFLNKNMNKNVLENIDKIEGTWIDEYNNYYEISEESFEMNSGKKSEPFYKGNITNILSTDTGYRVIIKGIKYETKSEKEMEEKDLNLSLEFINYTEEYKTPMIIKMNDKEFSIIRVE